MSALTNEANHLLKILNVSARKKFGQNFMVDEAALSFIAESLALAAEETVLEIGPGLGFLTRALFEKGAGRVLAVETDAAYTKHLKKYFLEKEFVLKEGDILEADLKKDFGVTAPIKVVGNIPYNITSPILEWLIGQKSLVSEAVLTMQWEVAERLAAKPGGKDWGALSIFLQMNADAEVLKKLGESSFSPAPNVDSAVVRIRFLKTPRFQVNQEHFSRLVRRSFQKRRKTLLNSLEDREDPIFAKATLEKTLRLVDIDPTRRPETLNLTDWARLSVALEGSAN